jgi:hypothetical protein
MDKQALIAVLNQHVADEKLDLPADALQSDSIRQQFALFLQDKNLILDQITNRQEDGASYTLTGTGKTAPFNDMTVTARFTAGAPAELLLTAQAQPGRTLAESLPRLQYTLASALQFKDTRWQLGSQTNGGVENGLSFHGTMDIAASLGLFGFLLGNADEVLTGTVSSITENVPTMRLEGAVRGGTDLNFIKLGPINLALITKALPPARAGGETQAGVLMEVSTSLDFTAKGKPIKIPLTAGIYTDSSTIRFDADTTQIISAGLDELGALLNSVDLSGMSFGEFRLENVVKLTKLTFLADPLATPKLESVALTVKSAKSWDVLKRPDNSPFLTLRNLQVRLGIGAPFTGADFSAILTGEIILGDARILMNATMSPQATQVQGSLDPFTPLSLNEVARYFLGETDPHTPELSLNHLDFIIQPGQSYELTAEIGEFWTLDLGDQKLDLKSLTVDWHYAVGGDAKALLNGEVQIGGVDISVKAKYDSVTGWDFNGALAEGQTVSMDALLVDILYYFGVEPPDFVKSIKLDKLSIHFNATSQEFDFTVGGGLPINDKWLEIVLGIHVRKNENEFTFKLTGTLTIGEYEFDLSFLSGSRDNRFIASYSHKGRAASLPLQSFVAEHLSSQVAEIVPRDLSVDMKDILFAYYSGSGANAQSKFLFGLDIGTSINLSDLPLVGREFPPSQTVSVDDLQLLIASKGMTTQEVAAFNELIPPDVTRLPGGTLDGDPNQTAGNGSSVPGSPALIVIPEGLTVSAKMNFGGSEKTLSLPVAGSAQPGNGQTGSTQLATPPPAAVPASTDNAKWFTVQKTFGPVHFERIGVQYQDAVLSFLLDAALSAAGLTLSLEGLSIGSRLDRFFPQFNLHGLGIDYQGGEVEIGGAFLKNADNTEYDEYDGAAIIKTEQFNLSTRGSYAKPDGHPSLFVYGVLNYPIGGPSFFFVTGLAAGFGYNRSLIVPPVEKIAEFPLVAEAVAGSRTPKDLTTELQSMRSSVAPAIGEVFLAVGVKFTSFKIIDSFALLTFSFGSRFEINLLGLSTLIVPTPVDGESVTPLAEAQMALKATFIPSEGFLGVSAQLTSASYILSRNCQLTGGYAFYSWFSGEHEGDFVQTLGGYHPAFNVPAHYPRVPRLGFNWRVSDNITIKGELYYALTANALMAGGCLKAVWEDGDIEAWFEAGADFLISWKPYHYDARIYVDMGVSYTFSTFFGSMTISVDIGADLHIWGPEFAGHAHIHLWIVSFDVSFGASSPGPQPVDWQTFRDSFLPRKDEDICGIVVKDGLVTGTKEKDDMGVINPKHFSLVTNSVIPSNDAHIGNDLPANQLSNWTPIGIGPMAVATDDFISTHIITITRKDSEGEKKDRSVEADFEFTPVLKNVPAGLWGSSFAPALNGQALVEQALTGFEIKPKRPPTSGETRDIDRRLLQYSDPILIDDAFNFKPFKAFTAEPYGDAQSGESIDEQKRTRIKNSFVRKETIDARNRLLQALGFSAKEIDLSETIADAFLIAPAIEKV